MKKVFKKIMYTSLLIVISICSLPMITNAKEVHDTITIDRSYNFYVATTKLSDPSKWVYSVQNVIRRTSDWNIGYCLQAHVLLTDGASVTGYSDMNDKLSLMNLTEKEIERIELIAYYGYGYTNHTSMDWYAATQLLIWGITDKDSVPYPIEEGDRTLVRSSRYDGMMNEINSLVDNHGKTVRFDKQEVKMKVGETIRLTDKNNILGNYFEVKSNDSLSMTIEGNELVITAKKGYEGDIELIAKENDNMPLIFDGANQKCLNRGDPTYISARLNVKAETEFKLNKVYGSSNSGIYIPEEGAVFELYDIEKNSLITTLTTNEDGVAQVYLPFGKYRLHQVSGKEGHKLNGDYEFEINGTKVKETIYLQNEIIKSDLLFTKTDITTDVGLPNTLIEIYNAETDELIFSGRTDDAGTIYIKNIEFGDYYIIEKEAPEGYELTEEKVKFSVTKDGEIIKAIMKDKKIVKVPDTADYDKHTLEIGCGVLIILGLGLLIYDIKKKKVKKK